MGDTGLLRGIGTISEVIRQLEQAQKGPRAFRAQPCLCLLQAKVELGCG